MFSILMSEGEKTRGVSTRLVEPAAIGRSQIEIFDPISRTILLRRCEAIAVGQEAPQTSTRLLVDRSNNERGLTFWHHSVGSIEPELVN
jgi:hypothetical protein